MMKWLNKLLVVQPELPAPPPPNPPRAVDPSRPSLGPNQLAWLDKKLGYYALYRKQAQAPTGTTTHGAS